MGVGLKPLQHMYLNIKLPNIPQIPPSNQWFLIKNDDFNLDYILSKCSNIKNNMCNRYLYTDRRSDGVTGSWLYPPGGGQSWHINDIDILGTHRLYLSWSETGDSGMLFLDENNKIIKDIDQTGWNIRIFDATKPHAVFSYCWRYSIGYSISGDNNANNL